MGSNSGSAGSVIGSGYNYFQAKEQAESMKRHAKFNEKMNEFNSRMIELRKNDIMAQSDRDVKERGKMLNQILGSQKAAIAAGNISLGGDIQYALEEQERDIAQKDIDAINNNAWREVAGLEIKQTELSIKSKLDRWRAGAEGEQLVTQRGVEFASELAKAAGSM